MTRGLYSGCLCDLDAKRSFTRDNWIRHIDGPVTVSGFPRLIVLSLALLWLHETGRKRRTDKQQIGRQTDKQIDEHTERQSVN